MPSVIDLYERLATAPDDKTRARIIAEAFEALEERYPNLGEVATRRDLRETELRLLKETEQVGADLTKEIENVRLETEKVRSGLKVEIARLRVDLNADISRAWLRWGFLFWISQFGAILLLLWRVWPK